MTTTATPVPLTLSLPKPKTTPWWVYVLVLAAALLPLLGGKGGMISNFTFLQISLMIVYSIAVLGLILLTGFNGQRGWRIRAGGLS